MSDSLTLIATHLILRDKRRKKQIPTCFRVARMVGENQPEAHATLSNGVKWHTSGLRFIHIALDPLIALVLLELS